MYPMARKGSALPSPNPANTRSAAGAGSMIAALCACVAVRFYIVQHETGPNRWLLDVPVSSIALMFAAGIVVTFRPQPLTALIYGTGMGALGAGLIRIAKNKVDRMFGERPED